jgi:uncharacterized circularly permuted ATP-grasp superfamily protein
MIRYYEGAAPILPNVPTYLCRRDGERAYVLEHLAELVVKPANESGGYGMRVGPHSTVEQQADFARLIKANPRNHIAQSADAILHRPASAGAGGAASACHPNQSRIMKCRSLKS